MTLSKFIVANLEEILREWEKFAKSIPAAAGMDTTALRNGAARILQTIALEMDRDQSAGEQEAKSKGRSPRVASPVQSDAESHSSGRLEAGFNLNEMVSEYRALRATVIRLWTRELSSLDGDALSDLTRFSEGIDQALTESIARYSALRDRAILKSEQRKDEFLATLAHELRNPLAPLRNALQVARTANRSAASEVDAPFEMLDMMERQVDQMARLVDDLLDVARITRGTLELRIETTDIVMVVNNALETSAPILAPDGHKLSVKLPAAPLYVEGDAARLAQVVCNLLGNAAKYSHPRSDIDLRVERTGNGVLLTLEDTGIGIMPEMLEVIFEMFSQIDRSLERSQSGLGIGLTLARQIVEMHGGTINASSRGIGRGSTFVVSLPESNKRPVRVEAAREAAVDEFLPRKILIADDSRDAADSMVMLLSAMGHEVEVAYNGLEALDLATRIQPGVILLDLGMPKMNGFDVARQIRKQAWSRRPILVAITGWGQDEDRQRSQEAGFDFHLTKPVEFAMLEKLLAENTDKAGM